MLTASQRQILAALSSGEWRTPRQVAEAINSTAGGVAKSCRTMMLTCLVEQKQIGWWRKKRGIGLFAYRRRQKEEGDRNS